MSTAEHHSTLGYEMLTVQGTASETVLVALLAAQARAMASRPAEDRQRLVCYSSDQVCVLFSGETITCVLATISATGSMLHSPVPSSFQLSRRLRQEGMCLQ